MSDLVSPGKAVLLRALDHITEVEEDTGGSVEYLAVVYAVRSRNEGGDLVHTRGWDATEHPHFVLSGLLYEVARQIRNAAMDGSDDA